MRRLTTKEEVQAIIKLMLANLPTTDPHINGALWNNNGVVTISNG